MKTMLQSNSGAGAIALAIALPALSALAGNTWDGGGGNNNWNTGNNWNPDGVPSYGTATFAGNVRTNVVLDVNYNMNQVSFTGTSPWTLSSSGGSVLSLFDFGGTQAKVENNGSALVDISANITFAANNASPPNPFGEINSINGDLLFSGGTVTVNGSSVNGIKLWGGGRTVTFSNTVSASGKWFGFTTTGGARATISGNVTSGDWYVMNNGTLNLAASGSLTTSAIRLGGDFGNTGNQNQTLSGTFNLTSPTGGQTFGGTINSVSGNTSGNLVIFSANTSGTNTLSGGVFLDSDLRITNAAGGTLVLSGATQDLKNQTLTVGAAGNVTISGTLQQSIGSGKLTKTGNGTLTLTAANTHSGATTVNGGTLLVNGSTASGSAVSIASGATIGGTGTINGTLTVNSGATLAPGVNGTGTLTAANSVTLSGITLMEINRTSSPNADKLNRTGGSLAFGGVLTVTNIGGTLQSGDTFDLFDATSFSGNFSTTNLPPGGAVHWITSQLGVNGPRIFTNNNPTAPAFTLGNQSGTTSTLRILGGKTSPTDADSGDVLTITSVTTPANGTATTDGTNVNYTANVGYTGSDSFNYTVRDNFGGTASGTVNVNVSAATGFNQLSLEVLGGGSVRLTYLGLPGTNYALDWRTNLLLGSWVPVRTNPAAANGSLVFTNTSSEPANFYRTRYVP
jgi:autotransporter-associated beta strand protein